MGTATKVRDVTGFRGEAALYRLDPPLEDGTDLVVASAVDLNFGGFTPTDYRHSETMVFPAGEDGKVTDWGEVGFVAYKSHADALQDMGYDVA